MAVLCRRMTMESERFQGALDRLQAAVERLEKAARPLDAPVADDDRLAALEARHRRLCASTSEALARLDQLIEGQG